MIKKSKLKLWIDNTRSMVLDLDRRITATNNRLEWLEINKNYSVTEARLKTLEDAVGKLVALKYPEPTDTIRSFIEKGTGECMCEDCLG